jgi:hypothetical protein
MGAGEGEAAGSKDKSGGGGGVARTSLDGLRDKNVMQLKKLNTALFPVRYNDKYYQDAIASKDFSKLGEHAPFPIRLFQSCPNPYLAPPGSVRDLIWVVSCIGIVSARFQLSDLRTEGRKRLIAARLGRNNHLDLDFRMPPLVVCMHLGCRCRFVCWVRLISCMKNMSLLLPDCCFFLSVCSLLQ